MTDYEELHYPNLMAMKVTVVGSGGCTSPPVRLPAGCVEVAAFAPPSQKSEYDFTLERNVLKKLSEREIDQNLSFATTQTELKAAILARVKNVTGAKDDICISMLESNGYDMKASIEAFYVR